MKDLTVVCILVYSHGLQASWSDSSFYMIAFFIDVCLHTQFVSRIRTSVILICSIIIITIILHPKKCLPTIRETSLCLNRYKS